MVLQIIIGLGIVAIVVFFRNEIKNFLSLDLGKATEGVKEAAKDAKEGVKLSGKNAGGFFGTTFLKPINIKKKDKELEQDAKDAGFVSDEKFTARQRQALKKDRGSVVIGSKNNVVDVGIIGDKLPTNPTQQFINEAERKLTKEQFKIFQEQQKQKELQNAPIQNAKTGRFGGQNNKDFNLLESLGGFFGF